MITFVPLQKNHFPLLLKWLTMPHVQEWWGEQNAITEQFIAQKYETYIQKYKINEVSERKPIFAFVICHHQIPIGYIQCYNVHDFDRDEFELVRHLLPARCAALDFYLGEPAFLGKGLGSQALNLFLKEQVFKEFDACYVDPEKENLRAIAAYKKAGFSELEDVKKTGKITSLICLLQ